MNITKYGHCSMLVESKKTRIFIDPGVYTSPDADLSNIDAVLIAHGQHTDHLDMQITHKLLANNPDVSIFCNKETADILAKENISTSVVKNGDEIKVKEVSIKIFGENHEPVYPTVSAGGNIGFLIDEELFCPGDAFLVPKQEVKILALPVTAPWLKLSQAIDYALEIKPKTAIPVHDGNLLSAGPAHALPQKILADNGIEFIPVEIGKEYSFK